MMTDTLAIYKEFDNVQRAAMALYKSGYFTDAKSEAQAIVKVMAGAELGLPPFASMTGIHIIQGKPALGSNLVATLVKNDPRYDYLVEQATDTLCRLCWLENHKQVGVSEFSMDDAKKAGLTNNPSWQKYPSDMLFARAITRGARRFAPGIFGGSPIYTPEELGVDEDPEGNIIETTAVEVVEPERVSDPAWNATEGTPTMPIQFAEDELGSDGIRYGDKDTETLSHMANSITKAMKKTGLADDEIESYARKLEAVKVILANR